MYLCAAIGQPRGGSGCSCPGWPGRRSCWTSRQKNRTPGHGMSHMTSDCHINNDGKIRASFGAVDFLRRGRSGGRAALVSPASAYVLGPPFTAPPNMTITVGVLALQGGFAEHVSMLKQAAARLIHSGATTESLDAVLVRTPAELASCDALVIPGGESTTIALIAARSGLMEPLRDFVRCVVKERSSSFSPFEVA